MSPLGLPAPPWIIAHRGAHRTAHENTVESVLEAVERKADMVELDLQLSADRELAVFHWPMIRCEKKLTPVAKLTIEELKTCSLGRKKGAENEFYEVPTLTEVLKAAPPDLPLNLELKRYRQEDEPADIVDALAEAVEGRQHLLISSFSTKLLAVVRERLPELPVAPIGRARWEPLVEAAQKLEAFSIHVGRALAKDVLGKQPNAGQWLIVAFTVDDTAEAKRLLKKGAAGIITNRPGRLRARIGGKK